ncbi:MAG: hypothetical protein F4089_00660 [Gammaproteobacteria bacterium]|nr:hypothetical protein [Gammaproteobacteria bacterium]
MRTNSGLHIAVAFVLCAVTFGCASLTDEDGGFTKGNRAAPYEADLIESAEDETPERPPDLAPAPIVGRPETAPLRVEPIAGVDLTLRQAVEYLLPGWELSVVLAHPSDPAPPLSEARRIRFRGGTLDQFLRTLTELWDLDVTSPHVGSIQVASRSLEPWLVTHWMEPPEAPAGGGGVQRGGQTQAAGQTQSQQQGAGGAGAGGGGVAVELVAEPGAGLDVLIDRLRELASRNDANGEDSVWLNAEAGLLYTWAPPSVRRAMRPLLMQYGARPVAADPELLAMMTRGQFRLRMVLVRLSSSRDRNVGLQWEEGLQAIFPSGRSVLGVPDVGYGGPAREDRLTGSGMFSIGSGGLRIGGEAAYDRDAVTFPFGSRWDLASESSRRQAMERVIELERDRTQADLDRVGARIAELERLREAARDDNSSVTFGTSESSELSALSRERADINESIVDLTQELGHAALRTAQSHEWLNRVTEGAERDLTRSLSLLASLGSAQGRTQVAQTISIDARHGRPVPLRIGSERTYLASISETVTQSFLTTSAQPETRLEGLDVIMRPWLEGRRCVRVGLALTNSGITSVATFSVGDTDLSIPQMAVQTWVSERRLCDSRPALLGRFKLESSVRTRSGLPLFAGRDLPLSSDQQGSAEEYLLLLQVLLPPEWGWR